MRRLPVHPLAPVALLLCLALAAGRAAAQEQVGVVAELEGVAEVSHAGTNTWAPLAEGSPVLLGDQVRTQANGKVRLVLREDSVLQLAPSSQLVIDQQLLAPTAVSRFQLLYGTLRAIVTERYSELRGSFEIDTPTAIAGVRGTIFIARYDPAQEETLVAGIENVTWVRARTDRPGVGEVSVGPGTATRVRRGGRPATPAPIPDAELRVLIHRTELARKGAGRRGANVRDARRPQRAGDHALSRQEQAVDQPLLNPPSPKPPPPPPPVPPRRRR